MKWISKIVVGTTLAIALLTGTGATAVAQEYKYEFGGAVGGANYMGDANPTNVFRAWNPAGGIVFRDNLNFRWALSTGLLMGKVKGSTLNRPGNVFPNQEQAAFERTFVELAEHIEFNFVPYSDKYSYLNTSRISPYIFTGLGLTVANGNETFFGIHVPLGLGVKYKLRNRLNLGLEWTVHQLFQDDFDAPNKSGFNLNDPYRTNSGLFKNKDGYNTVVVSITWEFGLRDGRCATE
ncbi:MAG: porin family protein [Candidatus Symbiothrix sp.]|jgi:opacity protein-like surface antigen|nr:porin family protein [Candidatus Symbiothrix sp.]